MIAAALIAGAVLLGTAVALLFVSIAKRTPPRP